MIFKLCLLSPFEGEQLTKRKKVAVILPASVDFDAARNGIVPDINHGALANRASNPRADGRSVFGGNGIKVHGGVFADEVGNQGRKKMAAAVKTFVDNRLLVVFGGDFVLI